MDHPVDPDPWVNEHQQRNYMLAYLRKYADPEDAIMLSDVDEIPYKGRIPRAIHQTPVVFEQDLYYYWINCMQKQKWRGTTMCQLKAAARDASCDPGDALAVLSLLSGRSNQLLNMEFRSMSPGSAQINPAEFIQKLSDWWRDETISDSEWKQWASNVEVKWLPAQINKGNT